jgi:acetolactate synthase-1/2/3 large subunit
MTHFLSVPSGSKLAGAEIVVRALVDQGVEHIFGYPGGAILPVYDAIFQQDALRHILVRHEQGAGHAAEGYARSTGKVGCVLVTSGPGMTNTVTALMDAYMDSIPLVVICGQVPSHLIGTDAFQEADTTGITRSCTKHNVLVKDANKLAETIHQCFHIARSGKPGPVLIDIPKDIQFSKGIYVSPGEVKKYKAYPHAVVQADPKIAAVVDLMQGAKRPIFYTGGGVINANASGVLRELVRETGYPITQTLMGLGAFPANDPLNLGMLGMHGTYEANLAMYHSDVMICVGARFDDRVTAKLSEFSPNAKKIHIDIDAASINKNVPVDIGIVADAGEALRAILAEWKRRHAKADGAALAKWLQKIQEWRAKDSLAYEHSQTIIKPQYAIARLAHFTAAQNPIITTEVGQHQMWAAQHFPFYAPNHWLTSGGLGTMGYGLPAAIGAQVAHPDALVMDIAGEASIQMNIQELSTAIQYDLPVKVYIINNRWMGMVRQWQQLIHGERYSHSYSEALPDFVKLAEAYGALGLRADRPDELDDVIARMIAHKGPVVADIRVAQSENCYPMIPSGAPHYAMILKDGDIAPVSPEGLMMV